MKFEEKRVYADLVVVGAGAAGMCAAIQAAREGTNVVLINDRGVVGGNCSTEVNITMGGAPDCAPLNINSREGGIVEEIRIETAYRTPELNRYIKDMVFMDYLNAEKERLHLYLNTCVDAAEVDGQGRIVSVSGTQNTTETRFTFIAPPVRRRYGRRRAGRPGRGGLYAGPRKQGYLWRAHRPRRGGFLRYSQHADLLRQGYRKAGPFHRAG